MTTTQQGVPTGATEESHCPRCGGTVPTCCVCTDKPSAAHVLYAQLAMLTGWAEAGVISEDLILRSKAALAYARANGVDVPIVEGETPEVLRGWWRFNHSWMRPA